MKQQKQVSSGAGPGRAAHPGGDGNTTASRGGTLIMAVKHGLDGLP